jgi:hypothetical protein
MYTLVLICEVGQLFYLRHLVFDPVPYVVQTENSYTPILIAWLVVLVFLLFGLFTTTACVVNYVITLLTFSTFHGFEYHIDYIYTGINLLLIFVPLSERMSLDALRNQLSNPAEALRGEPTKREVSVVFYDALILLGIALVYFDSVFYKWMSPMWSNGLGVWLPASLPQVAWMDLTPLLDQKSLMLFLGYTTIVLETVFIFLMWWRRSRVVLLFIGLGLHLAIAFVFPIPWFGLAVSALYLLLVPPHWYENLCNRIKLKEPRVELSYDRSAWVVEKWLLVLKYLDFRSSVRFAPLASEGNDSGEIFVACRGSETVYGPAALSAALVATEWLFPLGMIVNLRPVRWLIGRRLRLGNRSQASLEADGVQGSRASANSPIVESVVNEPPIPSVSGYMTLRTYATVFVTLVALFCQSIIILYSPLAVSWAQSTGTERLRARVATWFEPYRVPSRILFGTTGHAVFMDSHFRGYDHIVGVAYRNRSGKYRWLPMVYEDGGIGWYNTGRFFANWSWRVNGPNVGRKQLEKGIMRYTAFWAHHHRVSLKDAQFTIFVKRIKSPEIYTRPRDESVGWERGYYRRELQRPWRIFGQARWKDGVFETDYTNTEGS